MRRLSLALALCLICGFLIVPAAQAADIDTHWARDAILKLSTWGIMNGDSSGNFRPDSFTTRGEFVGYINRAFGFTSKDGAAMFADLDMSSPYYNDIMIASAQGYYLGSGGNANAGDTITREQAFSILRRVIKLDKLPQNTTFADNHKISAWAVPEMAAMQTNGYIKGMTGNLLNPQGYLKNGETAQLLVNLLGDRYAAAGSYMTAPAANVTVTVAGVTLRDMSIPGDLYITESVTGGSITLSNVNVRGRIILSGTPTDGLYLQSCNIPFLRVERPSNLVSSPRVVIEEPSSVGQISLMSSARIQGNAVRVTVTGTGTVELEGHYQSIEASGRTVLRLNGASNVTELTLLPGADASSVTLSEQSVIGSLRAEASGTILGTGRITSGVVSASGLFVDASIQTEIGNFSLSEGVSMSIGENRYSGSGGLTSGTAQTDRLETLRAWSAGEQTGVVAVSHPLLDAGLPTGLFIKDSTISGKPPLVLTDAVTVEPGSAEREYLLTVSAERVGQVLYATAATSLDKTRSGNYLYLCLPFPQGYTVRAIIENGTRREAGGMGFHAALTPYCFAVPVYANTVSGVYQVEWVSALGDVLTETFRVTFTGSWALENAAQASARTKLVSVSCTAGQIRVAAPAADGKIYVTVPSGYRGTFTLTPVLAQPGYSTVEAYSDAACTIHAQLQVSIASESAYLPPLYLRVTHAVSGETKLYTISFIRQ